MYLKRLEIQGFKSFADPLKLDFNKGISAIVGPNGSGKSNIADAIRWVLGEQKVKSLRGSKMEDIIFAGTENRKPLGFAEVSITLDNTDKKIPISFEEVTITRRVYRSGESEYSINRTSCRLKDIYELFMDTGVGKEGYSIIGQGQIDRILSSKPEDRRFLFEEAVGIVKYKNRKQEAEKKLEIERQNLIRIEDIIRELEKQIEPLAKSAEKTKKYLDIKNKLKKVDLNLFLKEADNLKSQISDLEEIYENNNENLLNQEKLNTKQKEQYEIVKQEIEKLDEKIFKLQNEIIDIKTIIEKSQGDNKVIQQDIIHLNENIKRLQNECNEIQNKIFKNDEEINKLIVKKNGIDLELKIKEELLEKYEKDFNELTKLLLSNETEIEKYKSDIIEKMNEASEIKSNVQRINSNLEQIKNRRDQIKHEKEKVATQYKNQQVHLNALKKILNDKKNKLEIIQKDIDDLINKNKKIINVVNKKSNEINLLTEEKHRIKSKKQIIEQMEKEYEGFSKSVKNILLLKNKNPIKWEGICGVVAELIKVPKGYEVAIEVALGSRLQNIVTTTEEVSKDIIEYLKKNKLGRATFLPLTSIKGNYLGREKEEILKEEGILGVASDIIKYDSIYKNIISYLLGRVFIVKNLNFGIKIARKYDYKYKIVTLDGEALNAGGSITGGSIYQKSSNFFSRTRELEELKHKLSQISKKLECYQQELETYEKEKNRNIFLIENKEKEIQDINMQIISENHKIKQSKELLIEIEERKRQLSIEEEQLKIQYENFLEKLNKETSILKKIEVEIEEIHNKVEAHQSHLQTERTSKESLSISITEIKIEISSLKQKNQYILEDIKRLENDIKNLNLEKNKKEEEIQVLSKEIKIKEEEIIKNKEKIRELNLNLGTNADLQNKLQKEKREKNIILKQYENNINKTRENIDLIKQEIHRIENKKTKLKLEEENLYNRIWEEYEETYNSALKFKEDIGSISEMKNKSQYYKNQIKNLGNINLDAIEEYEKVKERYEFLINQKKDIEDAEKKLRNIIKELISSMEKQFIKNFSIISSNFNKVFVELFGGGKGYLQLVDEKNILQSGIEIIAQPPGKKLQNMTLLSGGERALTAIALLFSILKMKPSPFCVLDEIEAALDDANVNRFANYLKKFKDTQFIVITHRKGTMEAADTLYGVTMQEQGISKLISVKLSDVQDEEAS
ncbi:chromosome segregation protein SMC [Defluviitalea phaphyphila]|uniref:chromosome segregation protein SMC n=1 Tax=Defluviitalea phaphyphila TaxID=1473580 RepID=UPI00073127D3|nr:chromosome segregation protein SMC [Defluviitalea phaphyphila]